MKSIGAAADVQAGRAALYRDRLGDARPTGDSASELDVVEASAKTLLAWVALQRRKREERPVWLDHSNYPGGPRIYARHRQKGLRAFRFGKAYRSRYEDCEAFWETLAPRSRLPKSLPTDSDAARWARAGIVVTKANEVGRGSRS